MNTIPFGFETKNYNAYVINKNSNQSKANETSWKTANLLKTIAMIPVVGAFVGCSRIYSAVKYNFQDKVSHVFRGILETLGLGLLCNIVDYIDWFKNSRWNWQIINGNSFVDDSTPIKGSAQYNPFK